MSLVQEFRKNGRHFLESVIISGEKSANITSGIGRKRKIYSIGYNWKDKKEEEEESVEVYGKTQV